MHAVDQRDHEDHAGATRTVLDAPESELDTPLVLLDYIEADHVGLSRRVPRRGTPRPAASAPAPVRDRHTASVKRRSCRPCAGGRHPRAGRTSDETVLTAGDQL